MNYSKYLDFLGDNPVWDNKRLIGYEQLAGTSDPARSIDLGNRDILNFLCQEFIFLYYNRDLSTDYGEHSDFDFAAAYAFGIISNHPFVDGNKRTGFLAAYVFLYLNEWELMASEAEVVATVLALAAREMDEAGFSHWLKDHAHAKAG